jgi:hypothetical protein
VFEALLEDRQVNIAVNRGFPSWTFLYENCQRLREINRKYPQKKIVVLYFGDYDPSGKSMDKFMEEGLKHFDFILESEMPEWIKFMKGLPQWEFASNSEIEQHIRREHIVVDFQRVAITMDQIEEYNLPHKPTDEKTQEKLDNDSRTAKFIGARR